MDEEEEDNDYDDDKEEKFQRCLLDRSQKVKDESNAAYRQVV